MYLTDKLPKWVFVDENQNNIAKNVQNIQFLIDNSSCGNYTVCMIIMNQEYAYLW